MAEANQYKVSLKNLLELIIKDADVHEGMWQLALGFQIGAGHYGPTPATKNPGLAITISEVAIQLVEPGIPIAKETIIADAAKVNPKR